MEACHRSQTTYVIAGIVAADSAEKWNSEEAQGARIPERFPDVNAIDAFSPAADQDGPQVSAANLITNERSAHADHLRQFARCQRGARAGQQVFQDPEAAELPGSFGR